MNAEQIIAAHVFLLNCILVREHVRPATLLQPESFGESINGNHPVLTTLLEAFSKTFRNLKFSDNYRGNQGIIVSYVDYNGKEIVTHEDMGKILGYPCASTFDGLDRNNTDIYRISLAVKLANGKELILFTNVCPDNSKIEEFNKYVREANHVFSLPKYEKLLKQNEIEIIDVYVAVSVVPAMNSVINKLLKNEEINNDYNEFINNIFFNIGFNEENIKQIFKYVDYNNLIHRGIIVSVLFSYVNNIESPFYPIYDDYPKTLEKVDQIRYKLGVDLSNALKTSSLTHGETTMPSSSTDANSTENLTAGRSNKKRKTKRRKQKK